MSAIRLNSADRRASIIAAARAVFARYGLEGARTHQIASTAGISEALVFRHFPTKTHIYRAVLRDVIADQNATFRKLGPTEASTAGLLALLDRMLRHALEGAAASNAEGMRMVVGSLVGDGNYARLIYRRALRLSLPNLARAIEGARQDGGLTGPTLPLANAVAFLEHVSTMLLLAHCHARPAVPYEGGEARVFGDALLFCARGLGISDDRIADYLDGMTKHDR